MEFTILSDNKNIFLIVITMFLLVLGILLIINKKETRFLSFPCFLLSFLFGSTFYVGNFINDLNSDQDSYYISKVSINVQTFKKHENKFPEEKDFYLSGFLNDSNYFYVKDGEKIFNPLFNSRHTSDFKITNENNSVSMNYSLDYDTTSIIMARSVYRYCLNLPAELNELKNIKGMKVSINGKDFDYKKATQESMKNICYSDKPNHYKITFF